MPRLSPALGSPPTRGSRSPGPRPGRITSGKSWRPRTFGHPIRKVHELLFSAISLDEGKLHAKRVGADVVINARSKNPAAVLKNETSGRVHTVPITASLVRRIQAKAACHGSAIPASSSARPGEFPVPLFDVVAKPHHHPAVCSSARLRIWQKGSPWPSRARLVSCIERRSTKSSTGPNLALWLHVSSPTSDEAEGNSAEGNSSPAGSEALYSCRWPIWPVACAHKLSNACSFGFT